MPVKYDCENCKLTFMLGGYHGHDFYGEYGGGICMVCWGCGLSYSLISANRSRGPKFFETHGLEILSFQKSSKVKLLKHLRSLLGIDINEAKALISELPIKVDLECEEIIRYIQDLNQDGIEARKVVIDRKANPNYGQPLAKDMLMTGGELASIGTPDKEYRSVDIDDVERYGPCGEIIFSRFECINCKQVGLLSSAPISLPKPCPSCGKKSLIENGGFVT